MLIYTRIISQAFYLALRGQRHINIIKPSEKHGYFDADGNEINAELIKKSTLCLTCLHNGGPKEELFCNMTRFELQKEKEFRHVLHIKRLIFKN